MIKLLEMLGFWARVTDVKQKEAILSIQGNDTFVSMPTRLFGKSVIYLVFDRANKGWSIDLLEQFTAGM